MEAAEQGSDHTIRTENQHLIAALTNRVSGPPSTVDGLYMIDDSRHLREEPIGDDMDVGEQETSQSDLHY